MQQTLASFFTGDLRNLVSGLDSKDAEPSGSVGECLLGDNMEVTPAMLSYVTPTEVIVTHSMSEDDVTRTSIDDSMSDDSMSEDEVTRPGNQLTVYHL